MRVAHFDTEDLLGENFYLMVCSYGKFCIAPGGEVPTIPCGAHDCMETLHHFCQGSFESSQESIIGTVESMFKRCLTCLLMEQGCFNPETCERLGFNIRDNGSVVFPASATQLAGSQRSSTLCDMEIENVSAVDGKTPKQLVVEGHDDDEDLEEEEEAMDIRRPGGQRGRRHRCGIKRVALTLGQQLSLIEFYDSQVEKISYAEAGAWAKKEFCLPQAPSKGFISKLVKNKQSIAERAAEALRLDRKRKKPVNNEDQTSLEKKLLDWIHYHDATHGGKIPLSDAMLIEQVCSL